MKTIEILVECPSCNGTGLYQGMGESKGVGVVCSDCNGTGAYNYKYRYTEFTGRKKRTDIKRVYLRGSRYKLGLGKIVFDTVGEVDMDKEGVSYTEFLQGKMPDHIRALSCPMSADQRACHGIPKFINKCQELNGGYLSIISDCKNQPNKAECWERFYSRRKQ